MFGQRKPVVNRKAALIEYGQSLLWFAGAVGGTALSILCVNFSLSMVLTNRICCLFLAPAALKGAAYAFGLFNKH